MGSVEPTLEEVREPAAEDYQIIGLSARGRCLVVVVEKKAASSGQPAVEGSRTATAIRRNGSAKRVNEGS